MLGPEMIQGMIDKIKVIQLNMRAQDRQKSYTDWRWKSLEFKGDKVFLKVSPVKGVHKFNIKGKLNPWFVGPYDIIEKINPVTYRLALLPELQHVHDGFHISQFHKYVHDPTHATIYEPFVAKAGG